jgi:hypothetical protein
MIKRVYESASTFPTSKNDADYRAYAFDKGEHERDVRRNQSRDKIEEPNEFDDLEVESVEMESTDRKYWELGSQRAFKNEEGYIIYFADNYIEISKNGRIEIVFYPEDCEEG